MKAKILIAGVGSIGTRHLRNLRTLGYRDLAACDPSFSRRVALSRFGSVRTYTKLSHALAAERPHIVFVCTPTHRHLSAASAALAAGAHVFIEKPVSHTLRGVSALQRQAKQKRKVVMVACNYRFHAGFQKLSAALRTIRFGSPILARVTSGYYLPSARTQTNYRKTYAAGKKGGGVILDSGSHVVDYLSALFGAVTGGAALKSALHSLGLRSEEAAALVFRHASGTLSSLTLDYVSRTSTHTVEITTDQGLLSLDFKKDTLYFDGGSGQRVLYKGSGDENLMFTNELRHFFRCVEKHLKPAQDIPKAQKTLQTLLSVSHRSATPI